MEKFVLYVKNENVRKTILNIVSANSNVKNKVIEAAKIRKDKNIQEWLEIQNDLSIIEARYQLYPCCRNYIFKRSLAVTLKHTNNNENTNTIPDEILDY